MFSSFKFGGPERSDNARSHNEKSGPQCSHTVTTEVSDDDEKSDFDAKEGPSSAMVDYDASSDRHVEPHTGSPRRTFMSVVSDVFRRSSDTSNKEGSDPPSRKHSQQTEVSRARGMATALGLFQSHNPDVDSEEAAAVNSPVPRKGSVISNHSGDDASHPITEAPQRRPSYMPRNATASFLKTANGTSEAKPEDRERMEQERARKPSVMGSVMDVGLGVDASAAAPSAGRRPSGMMPNNVASRYLRSAQQNDDDQTRDAASRRRSSARKTSDAHIRAVPMQADQFQQWQNSVQRNGSRVSMVPSAGNNRRRSIDDVAEEPDGDDGVSRQRHTGDRSSDRQQQQQPMRQSKPVSASAFLPDQFRSTSGNFGAEITHDLDEIVESESRPETPLESLGFKGAVPA